MSKNTKSSAEDLEEFYRANFRKVVGLCYSYLRTDECEDAAQMVFEKCFENIDQFDGRAQLGTWIYASTRNMCLNIIRAKKTKKRTFKNAGSLDEMRLTPKSEFCRTFEDRAFYGFLKNQCITDDPLSDVIREELMAKVRECILKLKKPYQKCIELRLSGMSFVEVGKKMDIPSASARRTFFRGMHKLKDRFAILRKQYESV